METETLIYALPKGETRDYMEDIMYCGVLAQSDIDKVIAAASADGWHSFRIAKYNGDRPNFAGVLS